MPRSGFTPAPGITGLAMITAVRTGALARKNTGLTRSGILIRTVGDADIAMDVLSGKKPQTNRKLAPCSRKKEIIGT